MPSRTLIRTLFVLGLALAPVGLLGCDSSPPASSTPAPAPTVPTAGPPSGAAADSAKSK